ncbi:cyclic AMP-dependent transcription factor ATF-7-like [Paramacrobiotus metropolitanus]|uniref:cyclic AMP-dependent transcription factor ATF-7-like n=1 Tax=Paramacrobiotus metropolitanus TaxID=2943436 RepID=UPI0024461753|nr:cyclic AMP-dependent transcription factor ATF-7-like [Paramacrobiotus metropolitanus]
MDTPERSAAEKVSGETTAAAALLPLPASNGNGTASVSRKPFPCEHCDMSFVSKAKLSYHVIRTHTRHRSPTPPETGLDAALTVAPSLTKEDKAESVNVEQDALRLAVEPARMALAKTPLFGVNETPTPTRFLLALDQAGLTTAVIRGQTKEANPFSASFRSLNGQSSDAPLSPSGRELTNPVLFGSTHLSPVPLSGISPSFMVYSPLPHPLYYLASPPPPSATAHPPAPPSAGFSNVPVFSLFPSSVPPAAEKAAAPGVLSPPPTNGVVSSTCDDSPPESPPTEAAPAGASQELSPGRFGDLTLEDAGGEAQRMDDFSETMSIHSDDSSLPAHASGSGEPGGGTGPRKTRPILETDDPVLADKRRRNRIAAEKCRKRRKERQENLEVNNQNLKAKYTELQKEFRALQQSSRARIQQLTEENKTFKQENILLRTQLGQFSLLQQQAPPPAPPPVAQPTLFAVTPNGQRVQLFLQPGPLGGAPAAQGFVTQ